MRNWFRQLFSKRIKAKQPPRKMGEGVMFIGTRDTKGPRQPDKNGKNYRFHRLSDDGDYVPVGFVNMGPTSEAECFAEHLDIINSGLRVFVVDPKSG